jgi:hypothetical protein
MSNLVAFQLQARSFLNCMQETRYEFMAHNNASLHSTGNYTVRAKGKSHALYLMDYIQTSFP